MNIQQHAVLKIKILDCKYHIKNNETLKKGYIQELVQAKAFLTLAQELMARGEVTAKTFDTLKSYTQANIYRHLDNRLHNCKESKINLYKTLNEAQKELRAFESNNIKAIELDKVNSLLSSLTYEQKELLTNNKDLF
tara:strand:- start:3614 stop:4024 length:411 start_codon:yes stop_codon:yes gene_type:complete